MTGPEQHANTVSRPDPAQVEAAMGRINGYFLRDHGSIPSDAKLVAAELVAVRAELAEARREVDLQMQEKLDAQSLLANIVEAIGLSRSDFDLSDTWRTVGPMIIKRLTEIVECAEAAVADRGRLARRVAELEAALEEAKRLTYDAAVTYSSFCDKCGPMDDADESDPKYLGTPMMTETLPLRAVIEPALSGDGGGARTIEDDYAAFARGRRRGPGLTEHDEFARCPECGHATVGTSLPYHINHAKECAAGDGGGA